MFEIWMYLSVLALLVVGSAFFSGSETALTTVSKVRLHQLAQQGNRRAKLAQKAREKKDQLLGTILVGNTFINVAAGSIATSLLTEVYHGDNERGAIIATVSITLVLLIFSEVLPKTIAIRHADAFSMRVAPAMLLVTRLLAPITWGIIAIVRGLLFLLGASRQGVALSHVEELRGAIELHLGPEAEVAQERAMLRSVLELNDILVSDAMTHRRQVETINAEMSPDLIMEEVLASHHTRLPLWRGDPENIVGVIHSRSLFRELQKLGGQVGMVKVDALMSAPWFIPESTTLLEQLQAFRARREHFALVVDEYGEFLGIITLEDILEEIVGDIEDENDPALPGVVKQANGSYVVDGTVSLRELNRLYDWRLPDTDASTIAGLVVHEVRRVPETGQVFEFHGFRFEIMRRQRNQITQLRVWPPVKESSHAA